MNNELWGILVDSFPKILLAGIKVSIPLALIAFAIGLLIAVLTALIRYAKIPVLKELVRIYIWLIRGTPLLVQLAIIFYGLPVFGIHVNAFFAAAVALSICEGAYMSESLRGAILSVDPGQIEAGYCQGLSFTQIMNHIVLPQAFRTAFPALSNSLISLVKDTSLAANITVVDMFMTTQRIAGRNYQFMPLYIEVALVYLIFCSLLTVLQHFIERKLNHYAVKEIK